MSEMVDRVARALWDENQRHIGYGRVARPDQRKSWEGQSGMFYEAFRNLARAAIAAMREPTEAMYAAEGVHRNCHMCGGADEQWDAMIDEALK